MNPQLFRQRLLELAAEYERLHKGPAGYPGQATAPVRSATESSSLEASSLPLAHPAPGRSLGAGADAGRPDQPFPDHPPLPDVDENNGSDASAASAEPRRGSDGEAASATSPLQQRTATPKAPPVASRPLTAIRDSTQSGLSSTASTFHATASRVSSATALSNASARERKRFKRSVTQTLTLNRLGSGMSSQTLPVQNLARFVHSRCFSMTIACLIVGSALMIGIETQLLSSLSYQETVSEQLLFFLSATNYVVTFLFTVEMVVRLCAFRFEFFDSKERLWNAFDMIILILALIEVALELNTYALSGSRRSLSGSNDSTAKTLRLFRLTRLLRLVRTFRQLKPLRLVVVSILHAGKSVSWAIMLLFMIVYTFGVILTQAVTEHTEGGTRVEDDSLVEHYGNLTRSILSLWMAISGGIDWRELIDPLEKMGNIMWIISFLIYIFFVYFFVLNVVTAVFCQNAIEVARQDLDLVLESQLREKQIYVDRLRMLFEEMNEDSSATCDGLTAASIHTQLDKPKVQLWFKALDVDAKQGWKLFKILDPENSGYVSLEDFVEGCIRLRGSATRVDVESLKWEIREANKRAEQRTARMLAMLSGNPR